ncbi:hypothetical protein FHS18_001153 [Paenibacillus phyllosphaerae]|uniref:DUF2971 domain-containing protein n=1 Tax=Paenibacillus phyllosphaerae TaxID=274593 RepID=A0A7W5AVV1_9BACL|nr:DUF2971 domain-containing protein [Paenibacillus phyllosphaerae]MBB3109101.1 hypothetical protein [Paenibacillus phyllosphaerae]
MSDVLYHYCSVDTFLSIIRHKTIRMSDICKSNDSMETKWLFTFAEDEVLRQYSEDPFMQSNNVIYGLNEKETLKYLLDIEKGRILKRNDDLFYVACFTEERDKLSQWRGYADDGNGLAIGFDANVLKRIAEKEDLLKLQKVKYSNETVPEIVKQFSRDFLEGIEDALYKGEMQKILFDDSPMNFIYSLSTRLLIQESLFYKNPAFIEEQEWRLVLNESDFELDKYTTDWDDWYSCSDEKPVTSGYFGERFPSGLQFRSDGKKIISFLDLSYKGLESDIIKRISIGPRSHVEASDIYHLLKYYGYENCDDIIIDKSDATYR